MDALHRLLATYPASGLHWLVYPGTALFDSAEQDNILSDEPPPLRPMAYDAERDTICRGYSALM